jgi:hypothetical protein
LQDVQHSCCPVKGIEACELNAVLFFKRVFLVVDEHM